VKVIAMIRAELARLTATTMSRVALIALMLVPVLYGGLYLWANHDPYAGLNQVPVALVVADTGTPPSAEAEADAPRNYGAEVAGELIDSGDFDWHRVSAATARAGVTDGRYDFSVTIPADFSTAITSAEGVHPEHATITLTTNDTNSYLASTIGSQATDSIRDAITRTVNEHAADRFLGAFVDIRSQLQTAADGAATLADGAGKAETGSATLADGTASLADGTRSVAGGAEQLHVGAADLADAAGQVSTGARQVADGNAQLAAAADDAGAVSSQAAAALPAVRTDVASRLAKAGLSQTQIDEITAALDPMGGAIAADNARLQGVVGQVDQLAAGNAQVADGAAAVATGASSLSDGSATLADGARSAADGAASAATGARAVHEGLSTITQGATKLRDGLNTAVTSIPNPDAATRDLQAKTIAGPVEVENTAITSAGTYGAGLAPFFASLAAWIGIYALFLIVKPVSRRAITAMHSPLRITLAGWLTPGLLGAAQMAALFAVLTGVLRFDVHNPLGTYALMALASLAFAAIILALNVWLGSVGQFLGLVLMVVQLVTAGGTFPWQTLPAPLAWLHHLMPMSYAVDGVRQLMYGGAAPAAWADAGVLALWLVAGLVVAAVGVTRMTHFRTLRDLRPSLIG